MTKDLRQYAGMMGILSALSGLNPLSTSKKCDGYKSVINKSERRKRTIAKKIAKASRKRNRR